MQQRIGITTEVIEADAVRRLLPGIVIADDQVAALEPLSGYADPTQTAGSLMAAAVARGAQLLQGCAVTGVRVAGGRVVGVETSRGSVRRADRGRCRGGVGRPRGGDGRRRAAAERVAPRRRLRAAPARHPSARPAFIDFENAFYARPEGESLTLVALEDGNPITGDPDASVDAAAPGFIEKAAERVVRRLPEFARAGLHSAHSPARTGSRPTSTRSSVPPDRTAFFSGWGSGGRPFYNPPAVGASLAQLITEGVAANDDLAIYRLARFAAGEPIVGEHPYAEIWR